MNDLHDRVKAAEATAQSDRSATIDKVEHMEQRLGQLEEVGKTSGELNQHLLQQLEERSRSEQADTAKQSAEQLVEKLERRLAEAQAESVDQMLEMEQRLAADQRRGKTAAEERVAVLICELESRSAPIDTISREQVEEMLQVATGAMQAKLNTELHTSKVEKMVQAAVDAAVQPVRAGMDQSAEFDKQLNSEIDKFAAHVQDKVCCLECFMDASQASSAGQVDSLFSTMQDLAAKQGIIEVQCEPLERWQTSTTSRIEEMEQHLKSLLEGVANDGLAGPRTMNAGGDMNDLHDRVKAAEEFGTKIWEASTRIRADLDACRADLDANEEADRQREQALAASNQKLREEFGDNPDLAAKVTALDGDMVRDLGDRGQAMPRRLASRVAEGVPPATRSPAPAPAPAAAPAPAPTPPPPDRAPAAAVTPARSSERSFTPSMRQLSASPAVAAKSVDEAALVEAVLGQQRLILACRARGAAARRG